MLEALDRTEALLPSSPQLRQKLIDLARAGGLPNQDLLPLSADQVVALLSGKGGDRVMAEVATAESAELANRTILAFEAIVRQIARPTLLVQDGNIVFTAGAEGFPGNLDEHLPRIRSVIGQVGRVELINHRMEWAGTGWLVDDRLVITNRHVAEIFAERRGTRGCTFQRNPAIGISYGARLDFLQEANRPARAWAKVTKVRYIAGPGEPDVALLEIEASDKLPEPVPLAANEAGKDTLIGVVGFPAYDSRNDADDIAHYFGDIFDKKRFAPGFVTQPALGGNRLMHDCTTLGGNSGSLVFDLEAGTAVGLHFAGTYLEGNFAASVGNIKAALAGERTMVTLVTEAALSERPDGEHTAEHFSGRQGYSSSFLAESLGVAGSPNKYLTPLPVLDAVAREDSAEATQDGRKSSIVPYCHFSVVFSKTRRIPRLTAVNIDGALYRKIKRGTDQWFRDLRLPRELQLTRKDYAHPEINRGHMVRREDPNWGDPAVAQEGNDDTFHYTNCAPQHSRLNQSKHAWLGLEDYILGSALTYGLRANVFTGPILRDDDPFLEGTDLQLPQEFWKVVVMIDADRQTLHATGYVLGQGELVRDMTEGFVFNDFGTYQVRIAEIARATGLGFGSLLEVDPLAKRACHEESIGGCLASIPLQSVEDVYLG